MKPRTRVIRVIAMAAIVLALGGPIAGMLVLWVGSHLVPLPQALTSPEPLTMEITYRDGSPLASPASQEARLHRPLPYTHLGNHLPRVVVALEDHRFFSHHGVDWTGVASALWRNARHGRVISGASTLSQQCIKIAEKRSSRALVPKILEIMKALKLERQWDKEQILEFHLNHVSFANRLIGAEAAAQVYFGKPAAQLELHEAVFLVALIKSPTRSNPWKYPETAAMRYRLAIHRLRALNWKDSSLAQSVPTVQRHWPTRQSPHAADWVESLHPKIRGGVRTTLDPSIQTYVESTITRHMRTLRRQNLNHVAVVVMDNETGAIRCLIGSGDYHGPEGQINGALIFRSPGSTLKPFIYGLALEKKHITAASLLTDTPDALLHRFENYSPMNYDRRFLGPVRVREALASSVNVPAVLVTHMVGAEQTLNFLQQSGLHMPKGLDHYGIGFALGSCEVRLVDLVSAFTAFASEGIAPSPRLLESDPVQLRKLFKPETAFLVADILSDNASRMRTFGMDSPLAFDAPIPVKTGTSTNYRDSWTIGSTREHTVGVWMGNFNAKPTTEVSSIVGPAHLWRDIIAHLLENGDSPVPLNPEKLNLVRTEICELTGFLPSESSPGTRQEWFYPGTRPLEEADRFFTQADDGSTTIQLPGDYAIWCRSEFNHLQAKTSRDATLQISSPSPRSVYWMASYLPNDQQMLRLEATTTPNEEFQWFINGKPVEPENGFFFWPLKKGTHTARIVQGTKTATSPFIVRSSTTSSR